MIKIHHSLCAGRYAVLILLLILFGFDANAAVRTFNIAGDLRSAVGDPLIAGTPFTGIYTFDDSVMDTNGDGGIGDYATGSFIVDFGALIGSITFDQSGAILIRNNQPGFGGSQEDLFRIGAGVGARNTPGFSNTMTSGTLFFRDTTFAPAPPPDALTNDVLNNVPHVLGAPWDTNDQIISWSMAGSGGDNPINCAPFGGNCNVTLDITSITEIFTLDITRDGTGTGTVTSAPAGIDCGATCSTNTSGMVTLTATPDAGSIFVGWSGCDSMVGNMCTVNVAAARAVNATFDIELFTLTVTKDGTGTGTVISAPAGIDCGGTCNFDFVGMVTLTATPDAGSILANWTGCDSMVGNMCTVNVNAARAVNVTFDIGLSTLTVTKNGTGSGTVTSAPAGIDCGGTCNFDFVGMVTLTATPDAGSILANWTGCDSMVGNMCTVNVNAARAVNATFDIGLSTLTVTKNGTGSGTVTSAPAGIDCGATCNFDFAGMVTLTATPDAGSIFVGWSGCDSTAGNTCTVDMNAARAVNATFDIELFTLIVTKNGSGTVTSDPAGINCGPTCSADFVGPVTLTATP